LIERCGTTEIEIERILKHSNKLYNFIDNNLYLHGLMDELSIKIAEMKKAKNGLKEKFFNNSIDSLKKGIKRKNINDVVSLIKNAKQLKEILDVLKILSSNSSKLLIAYDLVEKGKNIMKNHSGKVKILKIFEEEYNNYENKIYEKINGEFIKSIQDEMKNMVRFEETDDSSDYVSLFLIYSFSLRFMDSIFLILKILILYLY
jgi:hypothetical protein